MSEKISLRRIIVCVDGVIEQPNSSKARPTNTSNITRLKAVIKSGLCTDPHGRTIQQNVKFHTVAATSGLAGKLSNKTTTSIEQQVQDITFDICQTMEDPQDEIYLFGSGQGAYIVRAVAGVLHHMGAPTPGFLSDLPLMFRSATDLYKARQTNDSISGGQALQVLRARTQGLPNIQFVGLFDSLGSPSSRLSFDTNINSSIRHFRHALAFNENSPSLVPDIPSIPATKDLQDRTFVQAWFMGGHHELIGGTAKDGLSLYPLQWLLIESMLQGLVISSDVKLGQTTIRENPLSLAFPQFAGEVPDLYTPDKIKWSFEYSNKIPVAMFDLQSQHNASKNTEDASHEIAFESTSNLYKSARKVFVPEGLVGFDKENPCGNVIHPSLFCLLDRNQPFYEHARFKPYKDQFADFEMNFMRSTSSDEAPWLQGSELLGTSVKAFRILVCGKTGVGKSTLINKVFGVEMTEESTTYKQGDHDINTAFESPNHPGLLIHDSRGWQAGSDSELELIAQFLRHRAFQKDPAEALHVIWFCVDADVSRIEEADKRTFETIAQYSNHVPVFVVGTKKDKLVAFRKMQLLEEYMQKTNDYKESSRLANLEADKLAHETFGALREQLSQIKSYKADGFVLISKDDAEGVKDLITQTLDMITDDRVRLFCVAAQVVDVEHKIRSAITECMRLGTHAIRTAMVPLPFSGMIGTPTVSRILCEHVLQCFGFPKAMPEAVEDIMSRIVMGNLKQFMTVTLTQFAAVSSIAIGVAVPTLGIGSLLGIAGSFLSAPPTARMLLKCACDMILILERSFRYNGKYVSVKQIEDAAKQYVTLRTTSFGGNDKRLQDNIHDQVDRLVPLRRIKVGWQFKKLRSGFEHIIDTNRFDLAPDYQGPGSFSSKLTELDSTVSQRSELSGSTQLPSELPSEPAFAEMPDTSPPVQRGSAMAELPGSEISASPLPTRTQSRPSELSSSSTNTTVFSPASTSRTLSSATSTAGSDLSHSTTLRGEADGKLSKSKSEGSSSGGSLLKKGWKSMRLGGSKKIKE